MTARTRTPRFPKLERGWTWEVENRDGKYIVHLIRPDGRQARAETVTDIWGEDANAPKRGDIARAARRLLARRVYDNRRRHVESRSTAFVGRYGATVRVDEGRFRSAMDEHRARPAETPGMVACTCGADPMGVQAFIDHRDETLKAALG